MIIKLFGCSGFLVILLHIKQVHKTNTYVVLRILLLTFIKCYIAVSSVLPSIDNCYFMLLICEVENMFWRANNSV